MKARPVVDFLSGAPTRVCWTQEGVEQERRRLKEKGRTAFSQPAEIEPLSVPVNEYYQFRGYAEPDLMEAFAFLVSEVGELAEAIWKSGSEWQDARDLNFLSCILALRSLSMLYLKSRSNKPWVRNNDPDNTNPKAEAGDVLMMLIKTAEKLGCDPVEAMFEKWREKGWEE